MVDKINERISIDSHNLKCPVCIQLFEKAKFLSCHHSYCERCLEKIPRVQSKIACPECRKETIVPEGGVKKLADNFWINRMVDDIRERTHDKHHSITSLTDLRLDEGEMSINSDDPTMCSEHKDVLSFYCETCEKLACMQCMVSYHAGPSHRRDKVKSIATKYRKEMKEAAVQLEKMIKDLSEAQAQEGVSNINKMKKVQQEIEEADKMIDEHYDRFIQKFMEQKGELKR